MIEELLPVLAVSVSNVENSMTTSKVISNVSLLNTQNLLEILTTFLGFGLAILGEKLYDSYKNKKECKRLLVSFKSEFRKIIESIRIIEASPTARWIKPIKTPVWDSVVSTDKIALIDNLIWFPKLYDLYDDIRDYNEWHLLRTNYLYFKEDNTLPEEIADVLEKAKKDILSKIDEIVQMM